VIELLQSGPTTIGSFHLLARLGSGGFGSVFAAHDHRRPEDLAAVKIPRTSISDGQDFNARFATEIEAIRRVESSRIPLFLTADPAGEPPWLATDLAPGLSLYELVKECGPLPDPAAWHIGAEITAALIALDRAEIVHRDLTPSNVILTPGGVKVVDFGLAHLAELDHSAFSQEVKIVTPQYAAPELALDGLTAADRTTDVFMMGATLLFASTGHPPYEDGPQELKRRADGGRPNLEGLPPSLQGVVAQCLYSARAARPGLTDLEREFKLRTRGSRTFSAELPASMVTRLDAFWHELKELAQSCTRARLQSHSGWSPWAEPGASTRLARDATTVPPPKHQRQHGPTGTKVITAVTPAAVAPPPRIQPMEPMVAGPAGAARNAAGAVRWMRQFHAWVQAPLTIFGQVIIAADTDGTVAAMDIDSGDVRWAHNVGSPVRSAAVPIPGQRTPADGEVCFGDADGSVHAVQAGQKDGPMRRLLDAYGPIVGAPVVSGGRVFVASADGCLHAIDPRTSVTGTLLPASDSAPTALAASGDTVFVCTTAGEIKAIDATNGETAWVIATEGRICAPPLPVPAGRAVTLYVTATDGWLRAIGPDGVQRAAADLGAAIHIAAVHDRERLYVASSDGVLQAFDLANDGHGPWRKRWARPLGDEVRGLTVANGHVFAAAGDSIYRFDAADGQRGWHHRTDCTISGAPIVAGPLVYLASLGGAISCLQLS
jgi:Protein kinase domain/PQQ-like domain